ncbi:hypothetical protein EYC80_006318 [Monilinia laxa]|uniref:Uncharacterized protein n=1 Tax=Monilinia laxa TaxID=61186 RepID=A0A5N6KGV1_MONLA|nr:hypothetical protein EYC80_006318 [Monilinia laxa]
MRDVIYAIYNSETVPLMMSIKETSFQKGSKQFGNHVKVSYDFPHFNACNSNAHNSCVYPSVIPTITPAMKGTSCRK